MSDYLQIKGRIPTSVHAEVEFARPGPNFLQQRERTHQRRRLMEQLKKSICSNSKCILTICSAGPNLRRALFHPMDALKGLSFKFL